MPDDGIPFIDVSICHGRFAGSIARRGVGHLIPSLMGSLLFHVLLVLIGGAGVNLSFVNPPVEQGTASIQCVASFSSIAAAEPMTVFEMPAVELPLFTPEAVRLNRKTSRPEFRVEISAQRQLTEKQPRQSVLTTLSTYEPMDWADEVKADSREETAESETVRRQSQTSRLSSSRIEKQESRTKASANKRRDAVPAESPTPPPPPSEKPKPKKDSKSEKPPVVQEPATKSEQKARVAKKRTEQRPQKDDTSKVSQNAPSSVNSNAATGSQVDQLPRKLASNAAPPYPAEAVLARQEGRVVLRVEIGADGSVLSVRVHQSSHVTILDRAALETVRKWQFEPARANGKPLPYVVAVPVRFQLGDRGIIH